jgi:CheY-like chemotaxis protein
MDGLDGDGAQAPFVLIVEDNPDCQHLWERYLSTIKCRAVSTRCGLEALELIQHKRPAAIVLDVGLPDMDGWHVLGAIRGNPMTEDIPVVMCTALDERQFGFLMGADDYLRKPVTHRMFVSALARVGVRGDQEDGFSNASNQP